MKSNITTIEILNNTANTMLYLYELTGRQGYLNRAKVNQQMASTLLKDAIEETNEKFNKLNNNTIPFRFNRLLSVTRTESIRSK